MSFWCLEVYGFPFVPPSEMSLLYEFCIELYDLSYLIHANSESEYKIKECP